MVYSSLRIAGLLIVVALALGWTRTATAQPSAMPEGISSGTTSDEGLPWAGSTNAMVPRSGSMLRLNFVGGQGVGFDSSYLTLGLFQPFWIDNDSLWYFDAQGLLIGRTFDEKNGLSGGANVGVGYRAPSPWQCNTVWGAYLFYDYSDVYRNSYNQLGVGVEALGDNWDLRSNFYFPLDKTSNLVSLSELMGPVYRQYNMIFSQTEVTERAFWGFDAEVGHRLYGHPDGMNIRGYVGTYYYENWDVEGPQFWGIYGRVQAHLLPDLYSNFTVSHDEQFGTTAYAQLTWQLPVCGKRVNCISALSDCGPCADGCGSGVRGRLVQPVRRNPNIVVRDVTRTIETIATDPLTGLPISILHADSNAPPGGDGTFEHPFNTLAATQAEAATGNYDIILGHADSVFTGEQIVLPPDVRFLGEGIDHLVDTEQKGMILLPRATDGTAVPIIDSAPGNAIQVASNDEVSGFTITNPGAAGIFANGVAGPVNINRNTISGGVNGINILNSTGTFDVTQTTIDGTSGTAFNVDGGKPIVNSSANITNSSGRIIAVQNTTGGVVTFQGGTLLDDGGLGILINNVAGKVVVDGATLNNSLLNAVDILNSSGVIDLKNVAINSPAGSGVNVVDSNATLTAFTINTPGVSGIVVTSLNNNRTVTLTGNTVTDAGTTGIELNVNGAGKLTANVTGNKLSATGNAFDAATSSTGGLLLTLDDNMLSSSGAAGAVINGAGGGPITIASFANNNVPDASTGGILVDTATFDSNPVAAGGQTVNGGASVIGSLGNRVGGDGLRLNNVSGDLAYTNLEIFNNAGTGLLVDGNGVGPGAFKLSTAAGKLDTVGGPALDASDVTLNTTFGSIASANSPTYGIVIDTAGGTLKSTTTTVTDSTKAGISVQNSPNIVADFGTTNVTGVGVNPGSYANGVELLNNPGGKFTFGTLNITTDNGAGLVANNSGTVNLLTPGTITANGGPAVDLQNTAGQTNGVPGWTFATLVSNNSTTNGLRLIDLADPFTVTAVTTVDNATGPSIEISGMTAATFSTTNITNRNDRGIYLHDTSGNIVFGATTISGVGGGQPGVDMLNSTGGGVTMSQLTVNDSGAQGIRLTNNVGSFAVTGPTTIVRPQGTGIEINGGTGGATFGTVAINERFGAGINIFGGGNQNVTLGATTINNPNGSLGTVLNVQDTVGGKVTLASLNADVNNALADGVTLVNNMAIVEILGGNVTNAANTALNINGGNANVTFAANISNTFGRSVDISGRQGGVVNVTGNIMDVGFGEGIHIAGSTAPNTINFTGTTTLGTVANRLTGDNALTIDGNGQAPNTAVVSFANLNVFTSGKQGIIATNGGTLNITTGRVNTLGPGATGITLDGIDTNTTLTKIDVDNIGAGFDAVVLRDLTGTFTVAGTTTLGQTGPIGRGVHIDGGDATITFGETNVSNRSLEGVFVQDTFGTINFGTTTINGIGGVGIAGLRIDDTHAGGAIQVAQLTLNNSGGQGIRLTNNDSSFTVTGPTTIFQPQGTGIEINGGTGGATFGTVAINNRFGAGIDISGGNQLITLGPTTINNPNVSTGTVLNIDTTVGGKVSIASLTANVNNAVADGVTLANNSAIIEILGGDLTNASGTALKITGGDEDITFATNISNMAGRSVDIFGRQDGIVNITGAVTDVGTGTGIRIGGSTGSNMINFTGQTTLGTIANRLIGDTALVINGNGMAPDTAIVSFTNLNVFTNGKQGIIATNGGTLNITTGQVNTTGAGATGITLDGLKTDVTFSQVDVDNIGAGNTAIFLRNLTGSVAVTGATTLGQTGTIGRGIEIDGGVAAITFGTTNVANRTLEGLYVHNTSGTIAFGDTTIGGIGAPAIAGVRIDNTVAGSVNLASVNVGGTTGIGMSMLNNNANIKVAGTTTINGSTTTGIQINGGNGNIDLGNIAVTNSAGTGLGVNNLNGTLKIGSGTITNANGTAVNIQNSLIDVTLIDITANNGQAINLVNDTGMFTVSGTVTQNNGTGSSVHVAGGNTKVTLGNININNTAGVGIDVSSSLGLFKISGGTVSNTGGQAISIKDTTIDVTLGTVSADGGPNGIALVNTPGKFAVTGGTIQNTSSDGIYLDGTENVTLDNIKISNYASAGVTSYNSTNVTLNTLTINAGATSYTGIFADGTNTLAMNSLTVNSGATAFGALIYNSNNVNVSAGTYTSGLGALYAQNSTDGSIQNATFNGAGTGFGIYLDNSNNWVVRKDTINNTSTGIYVYASLPNESVTIEGNTINTFTANGINLNAAAGGSISLITGLINVGSPDPNINNVTTPTAAAFTSTGTITGKIQVNGAIKP